MPATSERQRRLMCMGLAMKRGDMPRSKSAQAAQLADQMSEQQLSDFCRQPVKEAAPKKHGFIRGR